MRATLAAKQVLVVRPSQLGRHRIFTAMVLRPPMYALHAHLHCRAVSSQQCLMRTTATATETPGAAATDPDPNQGGQAAAEAPAVLRRRRGRPPKQHVTGSGAEDKGPCPNNPAALVDVTPAQGAVTATVRRRRGRPSVLPVATAVDDEGVEDNPDQVGTADSTDRTASTVKPAGSTPESQPQASLAAPAADPSIPLVAISQPGCVGHGLHWAVLQWLHEAYLGLPPGSLAGLDCTQALQAVQGTLPKSRTRMTQAAAWAAELANPQGVVYGVKRLPNGTLQVTSVPKPQPQPPKPRPVNQIMLAWLKTGCSGNLAHTHALSLSLQASLDAAPTPTRARLREHVAACMQLCTHHSPLPQVALRLLLHAMAMAVTAKHTAVCKADRAVKMAAFRHEVTFPTDMLSAVGAWSAMSTDWIAFGSHAASAIKGTSPDTLLRASVGWQCVLAGQGGLLGVEHGVCLPASDAIAATPASRIAGRASSRGKVSSGHSGSGSSSSSSGTITDKGRAAWQLLMAHPELFLAYDMVDKVLTRCMRMDLGMPMHPDLKRTPPQRRVGLLSSLGVLDANGWQLTPHAQGVDMSVSDTFPRYVKLHAMHMASGPSQPVKPLDSIKPRRVSKRRGAAPHSQTATTSTVTPLERLLLACPSLISDDNSTWKSITEPRLQALQALLDMCGMSADQRMQLMAAPGLLNGLLYGDGGQATQEEWMAGARDQIGQWLHGEGQQGDAAAKRDAASPESLMQSSPGCNNVQ